MERRDAERMAEISVRKVMTSSRCTLSLTVVREARRERAGGKAIGITARKDSKKNEAEPGRPAGLSP
jgi:hypothetical protein